MEGKGRSRRVAGPWRALRPGLADPAGGWARVRTARGGVEKPEAEAAASRPGLSSSRPRRPELLPAARPPARQPAPPAQTSRLDWLRGRR